MPPAPGVDPDLVRQVMKQDPRPSAAEAAVIIARIIGKPVSAQQILGTIRRRGKDWDLGPAPTGGTWPAMDYACEKALGPIRQEHKTSHDWLMLTAYERHREGLVDASQWSAQGAVAYVARRLGVGLVTDYHPNSGFYERIALPWEKGHYYRQPVPEFARLEMEIALEGVLRTEVRAAWQDWLDLDRAANDRLMDRRS